MARRLGAGRLHYYDRTARAAPQMARSGDERTVLFPDIVEHVHHGVGLGDIGDGCSGQHACHGLAEDLPLLRSPEIAGD
jgi:hypothetical protein